MPGSWMAMIGRNIGWVWVTSCVVLAGVMAGGVVSGCSSDTATSPATSDSAADGGAPPSDPQTEEDAATICTSNAAGTCGDCMRGQCCDALQACEADENCNACVNGNDTEACERTTETHERVNTFLVCKGGACRDACIGDAGASCTGLLDGIVSDGCASCLQTSCCAEVAACKGEDGCWIDCFTQHDETKCHADPNGHALYHAMGACVSDHCNTKCN